MMWIFMSILALVSDSAAFDSIRVDSSYCGRHKVYVERFFKGRWPVEQTAFVYENGKRVELLKVVSNKRVMVRALSDDMDNDFKQDLLLEERHIGHPDSLVFHIYRFIGNKAVKVDDVNIGYGGLDAFLDINGDGIKEIISWDRRLAGIGGLDSTISPLIPRIYRFNGKRYVVATRRYTKWLRNLAKQLEIEFYTVTHQPTPEEFVKSKAMQLVAVYALLGNTSAGLAKVRKYAQPEIYQWVKANLSELKRRLRRR